MDFYHLLETFLKTVSKKVIQKAGKVTDEFLGDQITTKILKLLEKIIIPPEKREAIMSYDKY